MSPWGINGCKIEIIALCAHIIVYPLLTFLIVKYKNSYPESILPKNDNENEDDERDSDVEAEELRVN